MHSFSVYFQLLSKEKIWRNSCSSAFEAFYFRLKGIFCHLNPVNQPSKQKGHTESQKVALNAGKYCGRTGGVNKIFLIQMTDGAYSLLAWDDLSNNIGLDCFKMFW